MLGLTQGLSEFLPISSSGHLILVPWLFGWHELDDFPELKKTFDVALHLGTLFAVLVYFWGDLKAFVPAGLRAVARAPGGEPRGAAPVPARGVGAARASCSAPPSTRSSRRT